MEHSLRALIAYHAGVDDRIYPVKLPQNPTLPAITYQIISGLRGYTQDGKDGVTDYRVQINIDAYSYAECRTVRDAIAAGISGVSHESFGSPSVELLKVFIDSERDAFQSAVDAEGPEIFRKSLDLLVTARVP